MATVEWSLVYALACGAYLWLALRAVQGLLASDKLADGLYKPGPTERWLPWLPWTVHLVLMVLAIAAPAGMRFGFAQALSLLMVFGVLFFLVEERFVRIHALRPLVFSMAAVACLLPRFFQGVYVATAHPLLSTHLWFAMMAYSVIGIAAGHAVLLLVIERGLSSRRLTGQPGGLVKRLVRNAPALLPLERLMFRLIATGFAGLTVALLFGLALAFGVDGFGLRFDHKTVFSIAAWLILLALLLGRRHLGWRGKTAVRWTLAGFVTLSLAYVGSRFVLEAVLHRTV